MKTMTCRQLGGACDEEFQGETFDELAELSKDHAMKMFKKNDKAHMEAMGKMGEMMKDPEAMDVWMYNKEKEFNDLPEDN